MVEKARVRLLDELAGGSVEGQVVELIEGVLTRPASWAPFPLAWLLEPFFAGWCLALVVGAVGGIESGVAVDRVVTIDVRYSLVKIRLVEVVRVLHVAAAEARARGRWGRRVQ